MGCGGGGDAAPGRRGGVDGVGERRVDPETVAQIPESIDMGIGSLRLDLSDVAPTARAEEGYDSATYLWEVLSRIELPPLSCALWEE